MALQRKKHFKEHMQKIGDKVYKDLCEKSELAKIIGNENNDNKNNMKDKQCT